MTVKQQLPLKKQSFPCQFEYSFSNKIILRKIYDDIAYIKSRIIHLLLSDIS